ncbi:hypothetical protein NPIL_325171 [Nephila pilipes]|uniref:Uncharacterized protein n=1 Tax=Nephila pilipes TaxID=299642 RepID=A0A8X6MUK8_NEPPI|nr:hypothetical protein NPIL_325171 [Nephila pilipes]
MADVLIRCTNNRGHWLPRPARTQEGLPAYPRFITTRHQWPSLQVPGLRPSKGQLREGPRLLHNKHGSSEWRHKKFPFTCGVCASQ